MVKQLGIAFLLAAALAAAQTSMQPSTQIKPLSGCPGSDYGGMLWGPPPAGSLIPTFILLCIAPNQLSIPAGAPYALLQTSGGSTGSWNGWEALAVSGTTSTTKFTVLTGQPFFVMRNGSMLTPCATAGVFSNCDYFLGTPGATPGTPITFAPVHSFQAGDIFTAGYWH